MRRLFWIVFAACRIGFDPTDAATDSSGFVISSAPLASPVEFSWVALAVDWPRKLAYVASRPGSGTCVAVVDFSDERAPVIVGEVAATDATCLDVYLFADHQRLAVLSYTANRVSFWSLGADPRAGSYTLLDALSISGPRHFAVTNDRELFVVTASGFTSATFDAQNQLVQGATWVGTCVEPYQVVVPFGSYAAAGCQADHSVIELVNRASMTTIGTVANDVPSPGPSGYWTGVTLPSGHGVALGWVGAVLEPTGPSAIAKWRSPEGFRDAFLDGDRVWVAAANSGDVAVISFAALNAPKIVGRAALFEPEAYAIELAPTRDRGIVVTNHGLFVVIDPRNIPVVDEPLPPN